MDDDDVDEVFELFDEIYRELVCEFMCRNLMNNVVDMVYINFEWLEEEGVL